MRWDNLKVGEEEAHQLPGYRDPACSPPLRRPRGARHPLLRGALEVGAQQGAGGVADAVPLDDQPVQGMQACLHVLLRSPTHTYLGFDAGRDFEREIVVKVNVPEVLRTELARPSWKGEHVALGTNTDPYQWVEGRYKLMPGIWEAFRDFANPCSVLTKSPLLLRDLPLLCEIAEVAPVTANLSVPTLDEKAWRATEPHTPNPRARLEAVAELNRAGIPTGVLIAPLMPGINDSPEQVERILDLATEAGATHIGGIALHLRGEVREVFFDWLRSQRPDLVPRYEQLYSRGAYAQGGTRAPGADGQARWLGTRQLPFDGR